MEIVMQKIRVLMIDDNVKLIGAVKEYFKNNNEIDIVLESYDGLEGFKTIKENMCAYFRSDQ
jgi:DNA-binding NarL/FixJ family response regulator